MIRRRVGALGRNAIAIAIAAVFTIAAITPRAAHAAPADAPTDPAIVGDTLRLSVDEAVARALLRGADARIARARVDAAHGRVSEALAGALPQISGSVNYQRTFSSVFQGATRDTIFGPLLENSPFAAVHQWNASLTASQLLFSRKVGMAVSAAKVYRKASLADQREANAQVALAVRRAYYEAAATRLVLEIAKQTLAQARAQLHDIERLYRQGLRAEYDFLRAQVDARNEEPNVVAARNAYEISLLQLRKLADLPLEPALALTTPLEFPDGQVPVAGIDSAATTHRAAVESAEENVTLRRKALAIETSDRWPTLTASATLSQQAFPRESWPARDQFHRDLQGSLKLDVPLFLGGRSFGAAARARGELREAEATRDRVRQDSRVELAQARQETQRALAALAARRGTVDLAQRAYRIADVRYRGGLSTALELADSRLQLRASEVNEVQATRDYLNALAWLEFAQGEAPALHYVPLGELSSTTRDTEP